MFFPLHQKLSFVVNTGDMKSTASRETRDLVIKARIGQRRFEKEMQTVTLDFQIKDLGHPVFPGGPNLASQICGLANPVTEKRIFIGIDKISEDEYVLSYNVANQELAMESSRKLGIIMHAKFGESCHEGFHSTFMKSQLETFTFNEDLGKWESKEDQIQAEQANDIFQISGMDWDSEDESSIEADTKICVIEGLLIHTPGSSEQDLHSAWTTALQTQPGPTSERMQLPTGAWILTTKMTAQLQPQ